MPCDVMIRCVGRLVGPPVARWVASVCIATGSTCALAADLPDPCALLAPGELSELGMPAGLPAVPESKDDGRFLICTYRPTSAADPGPSVIVMIAAAGNERVLQLRAMIAKARSENTAAQLQARGEYYADTTTSTNSVPMCKVQIEAALEISRCISATDANVVTLIASRVPSPGGAIDPTRQLRLISELGARVRAKGG